MSEPTDQNPPDPHSDLSDDQDLSSLYARGSTEQPSDALDQAILAKAREATARHAARTPRFSGWPRAVSAAAVVVLSVLVVTVIHEEAPEPLPIASRPTVLQEDRAASTPSEGLPAPQKKSAERREAEAPAAKGPAPEGDNAPRALMDGLALNKEEKDQRQRSVENEPLGKATAAAPATAPTAETMASGATRGDVQELAREEKHCAHMTEQECFSSAACTLTKNESAPGYQCRLAQDRCEVLFRQSEGNKESCEARTGCVYAPASCYCPPGASCECTGGEPPQCQESLGPE